MNLSKIQLVLADQKEILDGLLASETCHRAEEGLINLDSKLAQVITGVRRSGKSTLCLNVLRDSGKRFGYVNFDDERLANLTGEELDDVLAAAYKVYGQFTQSSRWNSCAARVRCSRTCIITPIPGMNAILSCAIVARRRLSFR